MSATDGIEMKSLEEELRTAFELFDEDKDGEITLAELAKIMEVHGFQPSQEELMRMIGNADTNRQERDDLINRLSSCCLIRNGTVDFQEFLVMMKEMMRDVDEEETVRQAFNVFDKDGDGLISAEEIRQTMMGLGEEVKMISDEILFIILFFSRFQKQKSQLW